VRYQCPGTALRTEIINIRRDLLCWSHDYRVQAPSKVKWSLLLCHEVSYCPTSNAPSVARVIAMMKQLIISPVPSVDWFGWPLVVQVINGKWIRVRGDHGAGVGSGLTIFAGAGQESEFWIKTGPGAGAGVKFSVFTGSGL